METERPNLAMISEYSVKVINIHQRFNKSISNTAKIEMGDFCSKNYLQKTAKHREN